MFQLSLPGGFNIKDPAGFEFADQKGDVSSVVNRAILFVFPIAGLILLGMLIFGGFTLMTSSGNQEKMQKGSNIITNAVIGFIIIFVAYWIIQILQEVLGIRIY